MNSNPQLINLLKPRLTKYIKQVPTEKQSAFLLLNCKEAFYGGAAGGGKSSMLLMAALQYVDVPGYNALLVRDTYANLSKPGALIARSHEWLTDTDAHWNGEKKIWVFPSGATLSFGHLDGPMDHFSFLSSEFQFIGIDEIVGIRKNQALFLFRSMRKLKKYSFVPTRFRAASNPPAAEQVAIGSWVKERYVDPVTRIPGVVFIPATMDDNPHLDIEDYSESLDKLDPVTREQQKYGNWEIAAKGRMFSREWFNIVEYAPIKAKRIRRWDLAATEPTKANKEPDWTVGVKMSKTIDGNYFIEDIQRFRKKQNPTEQLIKQTAQIDGIATDIYMEQEPGSSGKLVISHYTRSVLPGFTFKGERASGSKYERAKPFASQAEAGNIYLVRGSWIGKFLEEIELFPDGQFDDQVDCASAAFSNLVGPMIRPRLRVVRHG